MSSDSEMDLSNAQSPLKSRSQLGRTNTSTTKAHKQTTIRSISLEDFVEYVRSNFGSVAEVSDDWVSSCKDSDFSEFETIKEVVQFPLLDSDFVDQAAAFQALAERCVRYESSCDEPTIWTKLAEERVAAQKLAIMLWFPVEIALGNDSTGEMISSGVHAASAYIHLCSIKGSQAFNVFNPHLYQKCLDLFRVVYRCMTYGDRGSKLKAKKSKGKKKANEEICVNESAPALSVKDSLDLLKYVTNSLYCLLGKVGLSAFPEVAQSTSQLIGDLGRVDPVKDCDVSPESQFTAFSRISSLCRRSFVLMHCLIEERHSHGGELVLSRLVYPRLGHWNWDFTAVPSGSAIPASHTMWKDLMVRFLESRVRVASKEEVDVVMKVLENLFQRCNDRADYRGKVAHTIVQILSILPASRQFDYVQRIYVFSKNQKNALRNFSVELVPIVLKTLDLSVPDPNAEQQNEMANRENVANATVKEEPLDETGIQNQSRMAKQKAPRKKRNNDDDDDEAEIEDDDRIAKEIKKKKKKLPNKKTAEPRVNALKGLYECMMRMCVDKSPTVRGRAIVQMALLLGNDKHRDGLIQQGQLMLEANQAMFTGRFGNTVNKKKNAENDATAAEIAELNENDLLDRSGVSDILDESNVVVTNLVLFIVQRAIDDEKANVRKAGLTALQALFPSIEKKDEFDVALEEIKKRCVDASVIVRKQGAETMTSLLHLEHPYRDDLEIAWLKAVMPLINDREQGVQVLASKLITETITTPILGTTTEGAWSLMGRIENEDNHKRLLVRALFHQAKEGQLSVKVVDVLLRKLKTNPERVDTIWMMLSDLSVIFKMNAQFALDAWYNLSGSEENNMVRYVAKVLTNWSDQLSVFDRKNLAEDLKDKILNLRISAAHISTVYLCLAKQLDAVGEASTGGGDLRTFGARVLSMCREKMRTTLQSFADQIQVDYVDEVKAREDELVRVIGTIGEAIQFSPQLMESCGQLVDALKQVMASAEIQTEVFGAPVMNSLLSTFVASRPQTAMSHQPQSDHNLGAPGSSQGSQPTGQMLSQGTRTILPTGFSVGALLTPLVRACCAIAIGKFCLMDEALAKQCVPVFVRQLRVNPDHIVRNNIVIVICDLCIRYTLLVDRYSPIVASCLKDRSTLVRHQTLESLTNLIKEQFIRWEGQIMYRFVSTILDEQKSIREYAEFCLKEVLLQQFPDMFYHHFIECLIYFNDVEKQFAVVDEDEQPASTVQRFSLSGKRNAHIRMKLYKFMIETFDDKQKFMTVASICEQILRPIMCGQVPFNEQRKHLLSDALEIMSSKEIKLNLELGKAPNEEDDDEPPAAVIFKVAAKKMISDVFLKGTIQAIVPPLLELRTFLIEKRSPFIKQCIIVLLSLCRDYPNLVEDIAGADKQLAAELKFDLKKLIEREKIEEARAKKKAEDEYRQRRKSRMSLGTVRPAGMPPVAETEDGAPTVHPEGASTSVANEVDMADNDVAPIADPELREGRTDGVTEVEMTPATEEGELPPAVAPAIHPEEAATTIHPEETEERRAEIREVPDNVGTTMLQTLIIEKNNIDGTPGAVSGTPVKKTQKEVTDGDVAEVVENEVMEGANEGQGDQVNQEGSHQQEDQEMSEPTGEGSVPVQQRSETTASKRSPSKKIKLECTDGIKTEAVEELTDVAAAPAKSVEEHMDCETNADDESTLPIQANQPGTTSEEMSSSKRTSDSSSAVDVESAPVTSVESVQATDSAPASSAKSAPASSADPEESSMNDDSDDIMPPKRRSVRHKIVYNDSFAAEEFAKPSGAIKKPSREASVGASNGSTDEMLGPGRAISTPNKTLVAEVTFSDLNLSAIRGEEDGSRGGGIKLSSRRLNLGSIPESKE